MSDSTKKRPMHDETGHRFAVGHPRVGGRKPGTPNKLTAETKRLLDELVNHGLKLAKKDYDRVRAKMPATALRALARFAEFSAPKLSRVEASGPDGGPLIVEKHVVVVRGGPKPPEE